HPLRLLPGNAEILGLYFFHQSHGNASLATPRGSPFQFNFRHGANRSRHIIQPTLRFSVPHDEGAAAWPQQRVIGHDRFAATPHGLFDLVAEQRGHVRRQTIESVECVVSPYQPIDKPVCLPSRPLDSNFEAAPSTFASDKPLRPPLIRGTL